MIGTLKNLIKDESGATAIEYGLVAALVSVAAVVALENMGASLDTLLTAAPNKLDRAMPTGSP